MLSIIIPTYNEKENLRPLMERLARVLVGKEWEVVVVDDNSPDGTTSEALELAREYPMKVVTRKGKLGLASAIVEGFSSASGHILGVIDADLQHPPEIVADLAVKIEEGNDIAIASRYTRGGDIQGWSLPRRIISKVAILLARPLTKTKDPMSGCFCLNRKVVEGVRFAPVGYKILLEMLSTAHYDKVVEVPYTFHIRERGESKLGAGEYVRYLQLLARLYFARVKAVFTPQVKKKVTKEPRE